MRTDWILYAELHFSLSFHLFFSSFHVHVFILFLTPHSFSNSVPFMYLLCKKSSFHIPPRLTLWMNIRFNRSIQILSALCQFKCDICKHVARVCKSVVFMNFDLSYDLTSNGSSLFQKKLLMAPLLRGHLWLYKAKPDDSEVILLNLTMLQKIFDFS